MYISDKKLGEMVRAERENGLTDNEIYAKISEVYSNKKRLAQFIVSIARKKEIEYHKVKVKLLLILVGIQFVTLIFGFIISLSQLKIDVYLFSDILYIIMVGLSFMTFLEYSASTFRTYLLTNLIFFSMIINRLLSQWTLDYLLVSGFNMLIVLFSGIFSYSISLTLFPNYPLKTDKEGKYVFKE